MTKMKYEGVVANAVDVNISTTDYTNPTGIVSNPELVGISSVIFCVTAGTITVQVSTIGGTGIKNISKVMNAGEYWKVHCQKVIRASTTGTYQIHW